jgi:hypothetical protein
VVPPSVNIKNHILLTGNGQSIFVIYMLKLSFYEKHRRSVRYRTMVKRTVVLKTLAALSTVFLTLKWMKT